MRTQSSLLNPITIFLWRVGPIAKCVPECSRRESSDIVFFLFFLFQAFTSATEEFYASSFFKEKAQASGRFLQALTPYLGGGPAVFQNMVC